MLRVTLLKRQFALRLILSPLVRISPWVAALLLTGCSTIQMTCPSDHVVTATLNGPNIATIATQLAALMGPMMATKAGGLRATPNPATSDGTLSVKTLDIFGVQSYSCGNLAQPSAPAASAP